MLRLEKLKTLHYIIRNEEGNTKRSMLDANTSLLGPRKIAE